MSCKNTSSIAKKNKNKLHLNTSTFSAVKTACGHTASAIYVYTLRSKPHAVTPYIYIYIYIYIHTLRSKPHAVFTASTYGGL